MRLKTAGDEFFEALGALMVIAVTAAFFVLVLLYLDRIEGLLKRVAPPPASAPPAPTK